MIMMIIVDIREILMESPKLAALNSDICSTEQLCQLYKNVKREMSDVLKFLIDNNEDDVGSQAGSFDGTRNVFSSYPQLSLSLNYILAMHLLSSQTRLLSRV